MVSDPRVEHVGFEKEFPDFPAADMPPQPWPAGFYDSSWRNDTCPSLSDDSGLSIFIDYSDPSNREVPEVCGRFSFLVERDDGSVDEVLTTDDWQEVLAVVEETRAARAEKEKIL